MNFVNNGMMGNFVLMLDGIIEDLIYAQGEFLVR